MTTCKACERLIVEGPELFTWTWGVVVYHVDKARQLVEGKREPEVIPSAWLDAWLEEVSIEAGHVDHVTDSPGILATENISGGVLSGGILIDGNHRAARALRDGREFTAYVLTPYESFCCMLSECQQRVTMIKTGIVPLPADLLESLADGNLRYIGHPGKRGWLLKTDRNTTAEERQWLEIQGFKKLAPCAGVKERWLKRDSEQADGGQINAERSDLVSG